MEKNEGITLLNVKQPQPMNKGDPEVMAFIYPQLVPGYYLCYIGWSPSDLCAEYMTMTYDCTKGMIQKCPAVVHVDKTARPQIIRQERAPFMFGLLNRWFEITGEPALINISFNRHEEPIVNTPAEAIDLLRVGIIDSLFLADKLRISRIPEPKMGMYPESLSAWNDIELFIRASHF